VVAAPWELHAFFVRRDVPAFGRLVRAMHDAQIVQVATMSSWLLLEALLFVPGFRTC
jgi:hypothetical protein